VRYRALAAPAAVASEANPVGRCANTESDESLEPAEHRPSTTNADTTTARVPLASTAPPAPAVSAPSDSAHLTPAPHHARLDGSPLGVLCSLLLLSLVFPLACCRRPASGPRSLMPGLP
jgi:hypothetical protein